MNHVKKSYLLLFIILLLPPLYATAQPKDNFPHYNPILTTNPTFTNNPTANPTFHSNPVYNTKINPQFITNTTSTINAVGMQVRDIGLHIIEKAQKTLTRKNYHNAKALLQSLLWEYRYNLVAITVIGAYSSTSALLLSDYNYLSNSTHWSHWKQDYSFEDLCALSHHELEQELIRAIGQHHVNKKNPTDLSHPMITFIESIEQEIKICKRYLRAAKAIKQLHLNTIFPINNAKEANVHKYLERALFVRHIFLSWLTERNLTTKSLKKISLRRPL